MEYQYAIGIDVSSASMTVASVLGTHTVPNTPEGAHTVLARLQARSQPLDHYQVAMEATGAYWMEWALLLYQAGRTTLADIVAYTGIDFGRLVKYRPDPALESLARWREMMKARPASEAGLKA